MVQNKDECVRIEVNGSRQDEWVRTVGNGSG